ncbi:hypothetical protein NUACC21_38830 [Scytonema sp. NUACC21]
MRLKTIFIRFYKSFNDDFIRKNDSRVKPKRWERIDNKFYPYIEVPIEPNITTIVGANESGKSHLLSAIEKAISGENIKRSDFCRYSHFFTVKQNELKYPDFGSEWCDISKTEIEKLRKITSIPEHISFDSFLVFRNNIDKLTLYLPDKGDYVQYKIQGSQIEKLQDILPTTLKIESDIALPASVPIKKLVQIAQKENDGNTRKFELLDREQRANIIDVLDNFSNNPKLFTKVNYSFEQIDSNVIRTIESIISSLNQDNLSNKEKEKKEQEFELAYKLICKIAQVDVDALIDLSEAIKNGMQGYANGIIDRINRQLSINLNFPNYWVQDRNFSLKVMARDYDLVFTITDRTGTEYSFDERSVGLKYFLSYYIRYRSHEPHEYKSEILLMDEPDAYLSSQAQQDLLKVFDLFASPEPGSHLKRPIQVVYVTHSPFLIDKNHAERIRVLKKGNEDEGTRVVKDAAKNHYEPLRSSIGVYVGETAFIGNCNLMVEGMADQILIAGAATYLRSCGTSNLETLDLNQITIVPSGSATQIPYLVYLACGRDAEQPAVIVLLDSDSSGNDAKKQLLGKGGQHRRPLLKEEFILQIGDVRESLSLIAENITEKLETEDLIPLPICIQATKFYLQEILKIDETDVSFLTEDLVLSNLDNQTIFDALKKSLEVAAIQDFSFGKVGFARNVIRTVNEWSRQRQLLEPKHEKSLEIFESNFKALFRKLNNMQRRAQQKLTKERLSQKIERLKKNFLSLHPISAKREDAVIFLDEIENILNDNVENESFVEIDAIKSAIQNLRRDYKLDIEMSKTIDDYMGFQMGIERIKYAGILATQEDSFEEEPITESDSNEEAVGRKSFEFDRDINPASQKETTENAQNTRNPRRKKSN